MTALKHSYKNGTTVEVLKLSNTRYLVRSRLGLAALLIREFTSEAAALAFYRFCRL